MAERMIPGLGLGVVVRAGVADRMSVEGGLAYRVRGNRFADDEYDFPNSTIYWLGVKMRIDYVSVPVLFNYHFLQDAGDLRIFAGFEAGGAVNSSGALGTVDDLNRPDPIPIEFDAEPFDIGPVLGFGFDMPIDRRAFGIDGRFYLGLLDTIPEFAPWKTRQLSIAITYWLNRQ